MTLTELNQLAENDASHAFMQCCTSSAWVRAMVQSRPFAGETALYQAADQHWQGLSESDYLEAFEGHPKIGDVNSLRAKYANTKALASGEQSAVNSASEQVLNDLARGNSDYEAKFGFIFIVCATGKSAEEMLALLQARLPNERAQELVNAAEEQRKIFHIRLDKCLGKS
ncbi:2-oxo-4-hydroxy-4-carboxy-5-ureidoimidazoline decarboxylase [Thalassomonas viridans]|uniref:2-oxo-4-hydroxy-4-carboxy-5-ureidoimidazoline decarboxylase n=1 Tax=Thalassomonas viridans TaxID=137584 RepID=A0AAE9YZ97_9GAMM|nr:2-oxo-4-hydroxy-4-carboxy-5-ureidoimidazoline decarboxylase [Thalassomonas viridans]WDE03124.1 2-oxo-4-hydroxy-4-carboxy-5-ureidoimidazoline decarboxylase [Thalassomonas viridans]